MTGFPRSSAELIKNTSTVSPTTLPTVKDALDNLGGRTPSALPVPIAEGGTGQITAVLAFNALSPLTTLGDILTNDGTNDVRVAVGAADTFLGSTGAAVPSYRTAAQLVASIAATQSDQETATSTTTAVTPGRQQFHPSAVKAWWYGSVAASVATTSASYNVSATSSAGAGLLALSWDVDFSSTSYACVGMADEVSRAVSITSRTTNGAGFTRWRDSVGAEDGGMSVAALGDQ
jgi:trimeric autotransporter adhesin